MDKQKEFEDLVNIGRDARQCPLFRDKFTGEWKHDKALIESIEKNENEYQNYKYKGIAEKDFEQLKFNELFMKRLAHPDKRKIDWVEYGFYLLGDLKDKRVCDFGCGFGETAVYMAKCGANVHAFDISSFGVEATKRAAKANNVENKIIAEVRSAHDTKYPDNFFDAVLAVGVLHHLKLDYAVAEIKRILKPGGKFVFLEPVINHPLIEFLKWKTPLHRYLSLPTASKFEKSLEKNDIECIKSIFPNTKISKFRLFAMLESKLNDDRQKIYRLYFLDYIIFSIIPFLRRFASAVVGIGVK